MTYNFNYPRILLDELSTSTSRELHSKVEILDWKENTIGEIQGKITEGNLNVDGNSAVRRTCSLSMFVDESNYNITSLANEVSLNKKARIFVGLTNTIKRFAEFGDIIWFPLGIFVLTDGSITHNTTSGLISINAQDKMCLLSGEVGGQLQSPVELHKETYYNNLTKKYETRDLLVYDIIKYAVVGLGGENPAKVIINDVPLEFKEPMRYIGTAPKYFDANNNEVHPEDPSVTRILRPEDFAGYRLSRFTYPTEFIKNAGDTVASILEDVKKALGNYEYFYDVNGNFIFQEVKNYTNTLFTPLTRLSNGNYIADFTKVPYTYSFKESQIVSSYTNVPDWKNIKNDYVVWGMKGGGKDVAAIPIQFHLAIDNKPFLPPSYDKPWQQHLIEYGDNNAQDPGRHYTELKAKFPQIYDAQQNTWKTDPSNFNYYFDMIDAKSELGKFSIDTIGRRTKTVIDENVSRMYPPEIPEIIILQQGVSQEYINYLISAGMRFQIVADLSPYRASGVGKDAFTVVRELVYYHTTFNEVITLTCLPLYFLEVNHRIEAEDQRSNIFGEYVVKTISIPFNVEGFMTIGAVRVSSRI